MNENEIVTLAMGSGGRSYHRLVEEVFVPAFDNAPLRALNDSALCPVIAGEIALTTDSFVVRPRFFPGGDLGQLAVCGTVNDLAMSGAQPLYLTCGMILEAGFLLAELKLLCASMAKAARQAGVSIVTGDTKVVEQGSCDGIFINTAGVGVFEKRAPLPQQVQKGDAILVSGSLGAHGMAVMAAREKFAFTPPIQSDVAPLNGLTEALLTAVPDVHALRDATRGGLAAVLNEWVEASACAIQLSQAALPVSAPVQAACDLLGLDPLFVANEGKLVAAVPAAKAEAALAAMQQHPLGKDAAIIGLAISASQPLVTLSTPYGAQRIVMMPEGEFLPRIC